MKYGEPWTTKGKHAWCQVWRADGLMIAGTGGTSSNLPEHENLREEQEAAAARIVACVNACAGLDLPDDVQADALAELVAACEGMLASGGWVAPWYTDIQAALAKLGRGGA